MRRIFVILIFAGVHLFADAQDTIALKEIVYGYKEGVALVMNLIEPPQKNGIAVIRVISSGWISHIPGSTSIKKFKAFTDRGHTVFLVSHGSQPRYKVTEIFGQIQRAVRFIRYNANTFGIDPNRIGITGVSAGAHLSLLTGVSESIPKADISGDSAKHLKFKVSDPIDLISSKVGAVGCFCPPSNLVEFTSSDSNIFHSGRTISLFPNAFSVTAMNTKDEQNTELKKISPFYYITNNTPPTIIIHGNADPLIPITQSIRFIKKLKINNVPGELVIKNGTGHTWETMNDDNEIIAEWFEKYLSPQK